MPDPRWTLTIAPLLSALAPERVAVAGIEPELRACIATAGLEIVTPADPSAEAAVIAEAGAFTTGRSLTVVLGAAPAAGAAGVVWREDVFGGLTAVAAESALAASERFRAAWERLGGPEHLRETVQELERRRVGLLDELEQVVEGIEAAELELEPLQEALSTATVQLRALLRRKRMLERQLATARALAAQAQEQLVAERRWVSEQVMALAASQSWRVGHRLIRTLRAATLRHDQGADALTVILRRLQSAGNRPQG